LPIMLRFFYFCFSFNYNKINKFICYFLSSLLTQATTFFIFDTFRSSSKLISTFTGHTDNVWNIDYSTFADCQFICSGSSDQTVRVCDVDNNKQIQSFNGHSEEVYCVKFSSYHYHNHRQNVICSSSFDKTIRFWDFKHNKELQIFNGHTSGVCVVDICVMGHMTKQFVYGMLKHQNYYAFSMDMKIMSFVLIFPHCKVRTIMITIMKVVIGVIGGNGYTICSGSWKIIRIWDIETTKQLNVFEEHDSWIRSVKYGSNELVNTILSGSDDKSVCLWDIRSGEQIQVFYGHKDI
ncbi:F-box and wd40 domain protein, partial [Reticulomyxa filosa]